MLELKRVFSAQGFREIPYDRACRPSDEGRKLVHWRRRGKTQNEKTAKPPKVSEPRLPTLPEDVKG